LSRTSERPSSRLSKLSEEGFHRWLFAHGVGAKGQLLSVGDDAVALPCGRGEALVLSTDAVLEGTHFPPGTPGRWVGRFAAAVNFSDLAAKGARPTGLLAALQAPRSMEARRLEEVVEGLREMARECGTDLLGGDTKSGPRLNVVPTVVGRARSDALMPRSAGVLGDLLVTTGTTGRGALGYLRWRASPSPRGPRLRSLLRVTPRLREGMALASWAHATVDTSDGLLKSARLLAEASGLGAEIDLARVPYEPALERYARSTGRTVESLAFAGGDYELLSALPASRWEGARRAVERVGGALTVVGSLGARGRERLRTPRGPRPFPKVGWDSFAPGRGPP
jgi:thiamine-monophosphate kinase